MPSDATSLATGAAARSGRNASTSMSAPSTRTVDQRQRDGEPFAHREAELTGGEAPERVPGDHGLGAHREVDDAGPAVHHHETGGDARYERSRPEAEHREEEYLCIKRLLSRHSAGGSRRRRRLDPPDLGWPQGHLPGSTP